MVLGIQDMKKIAVTGVGGGENAINEVGGKEVLISMMTPAGNELIKEGKKRQLLVYC